MTKKCSRGTKEWCNKLKEQDIKFYILSNTNKKEKVEKVAKELEIPYIMFAKKPFKKGFTKIKNQLGLKAEEIAVCGDQIFTDVVGANRSRNVCNTFKTTRQKRHFNDKNKKTIRRNDNKKIYKKDEWGKKINVSIQYTYTILCTILYTRNNSITNHSMVH
ncbi:MAG: HAD-IA family hydrolase [Clostridia bacterium]|nr:HAD-IA family hydrolase [Clostridia bacterium]